MGPNSRTPKTICPWGDPDPKGLWHSDTASSSEDSPEEDELSKEEKGEPHDSHTRLCPLEVTSRLMSKASKKLQLPTSTVEDSRVEQQPCPSRHKFMLSESPSQALTAPFPDKLIKFRN